MKKYDSLIIGSGPGGYVCAIRCAQNGLKTALVEKYPNLGGTCLNVGCIPSKSLLHSSDLYYEALKKFHKHGIEFSNLKFNWQQIQKTKSQVIDNNRRGIKFLLKKNNIDLYEGMASFVDKNNVAVQNKIEKININATNIVIATGSKPSDLANINFDKEKIISSTEALSLNNIPDSMIIIGAGVIGCELGSIYTKLGCYVKIVEYCDSVLPTMDRGLGLLLQKELEKAGIQFFLSSEVTSSVIEKNGVIIKVKNNQGEQELSSNVCLLAVGRKAFTKNLQLEKVGLKTTQQGFISTNSQLQTQISNIYAIGDVAGGLMLAHKAEEEGIYVADKIANQMAHINYKTIPSVVYTTPEVASVGLSEEELKKESIQYKKGVFPFSALGKAQANLETAGSVKVLADKITDEILGVHIIGSRASDLISEAVVSMEYKASAEDLAMINHAHPTFSEALKEASLAAFNNKPIHI